MTQSRLCLALACPKAAPEGDTFCPCHLARLPVSLRGRLKILQTAGNTGAAWLLALRRCVSELAVREGRMSEADARRREEELLELIGREEGP